MHNIWVGRAYPLAQWRDAATLPGLKDWREKVPTSPQASSRIEG